MTDGGYSRQCVCTIANMVHSSIVPLQEAGGKFKETKICLCSCEQWRMKARGGRG